MQPTSMGRGFNPVSYAINVLLRIEGASIPSPCPGASPGPDTGPCPDASPCPGCCSNPA